jgi:low temperature requirement protein LtrA
MDKWIMSKRSLWELPELNYREEQGEHSKVTWLELFFDLFFVASIAQIAHGMYEHLSWQGAEDFFMLFIPVWWIWIGFTNYNERFESNGLEIRFFTFLLMLPVIGLALFSHHGIDKGFQGIVLSYVSARLFLTILWVRAACYIPLVRPTAIRFVIGFAGSLALSLSSVFVKTDCSYYLFSVALFIDLLTPLTTVTHQMKLPLLSSSKRPERVGLLVIIVLGEMVVGVVNGLANVHHLTLSLFLEASLGVTLGFAFWWIYFDFIARRPPKSGISWGFAWGYLHLPLVMAFTATGAGISSVIGKEEMLPLEAKQVIASAVACALMVMSLIERTLHRESTEPSHEYLSPLLKFFTGCIALTVGWTDMINSSLSLLFALVILLLLQISYGIWVWFRQELPEKVKI